MQAKDLLVYNSCHGQAVEHLIEVFPHTEVEAIFACNKRMTESGQASKQAWILRLTLIIEAVYSIDASALVVAPQHEEVRRILHFVGQEEHDAF